MDGASLAGGDVGELAGVGVERLGGDDAVAGRMADLNWWGYRSALNVTYDTAPNTLETVS